MFRKTIMKETVSDLLEGFKAGRISLEEVISILDEQHESGEKRFLNGHVVLDMSREKRCGFPEFVFGANKTADQLVEIVNRLYEKKSNILVTRLSKETSLEIRNKIPGAVKYDELGKVLYHINKKTKKNGAVAILTAGTSDVPVALEAQYTVEVCGCKANTFFDIGVAGIHRVFNRIDEIRKSDVAIVVAGMEGALPSVVGGLVAMPVIAVPTSIGYGAALSGLTAMFSMLNSCANGVTVVNIDNGFGAGCAAVRYLNSLTTRSCQT